MRRTADEVGWVHHGGYLLKAEGELGICSEPVEKVTAFALLHSCRCRHGIAADDLMQPLAVAALFDCAHQKIFGCDEGKVFEHRLFDDFFIDMQPLGDISHKPQHRIAGEEALGKRNAAVGGIIKSALEPLGRCRHRGIERIRHNVPREGAYALGAHRVALICHCGRADLVLFKGLFNLAEMLQKP